MTPGHMIRSLDEGDLDAVASLLQSADDSRVVSHAGLVHWRMTRPERARMVELVADVDGAVVADGVAGLNTQTSTEGAGWALVTVDVASRGQGIGAEVGARLLEHLRGVGATRATSMFGFSEEGERWASAQGWSRLQVGPLIALDPRSVPEPSVPPGFRCVAMSNVDPEALKVRREALSCAPSRRGAGRGELVNVRRSSL